MSRIKRRSFRSSRSATQHHDILGNAIRSALAEQRPTLRAGAGLAALGFAGLALAAPFPAEIELSRLLPEHGGDGSAGVAWDRVGWYDQIASSISDAGDVNGDGINDLIIGARYLDLYDGRGNTGGAYIIFGRDEAQGAFPKLWELDPAFGGDGSKGFIIKGVGRSDWAGDSVSTAGDVNGDGVDDLIIGAPFAEAGGRDWSGQSYVVFGRPTPDLAFPAVLDLSSLFSANGGDGSRGFVLNGIDAGDISGTTVGSAGDLNGDGIDDLLVAAYLADVDGRESVGETYVVFGRDDAVAAFPAELELSSLLPENGGEGQSGFILYGVDEFDGAGHAVGGAGDVNGDGIDDLIIGASDATTGKSDLAGESYVIFGRSAATGSFPAEFPLSSLMPVNGGDGSTGFILRGIKRRDRSGYSVDGAGDLNGDSIDDIVIGAYRAGPVDSYAGEAYVVFGKDGASKFPAVFKLRNLLPAQGGDGSQGFVVNGLGQQDYLGASVSAAGDVNGDGMADVLIGARQGDPGGREWAGRTFVLFGQNSTADFPTIFDVSSLLHANGGDGSVGFVLNGVDPGDTAGSSVAAGDLNGDGIDDILVGARWANYYDDDAGRGEAYLVFGQPSMTARCNGLKVTIMGSEGPDVIYGTAGRDVIHSLGGNDTIRGLGGHDVLCAGEGNDTVYGGAGDDTMFGGSGNDKLLGGGGTDIMRGGDGDDVLRGGYGNDQLFGLKGADRLFGEGGNDALDGGIATDRCDGGGGSRDTATNCEVRLNIP